MTVTIYHNPACGTSRNVLALIRNAGIEPKVIEYLKHPPTRTELLDLVSQMDVPLRTIMRRKATPFDELGLGDPSLGDNALLDAIDKHPILINRPIVVTPLGVRLCRPSETVLDLLDRPQRSEFFKEDGEPVIVGQRLDGKALELLKSALTSAGLPSADIGLPGQCLYRFTTTLDETVGFGGIEGDGADRLLRSLVVLPDKRGRHYGKAIANSLERLAGEDGAERLHLLTTDAASFFETTGYASSERDTAPATIARTAEFTTLCPASARYMVKSVRTSW